MAGRVWRRVCFQHGASLRGRTACRRSQEWLSRHSERMRVMPPSHSPLPIPTLASILARGRWCKRETSALRHAPRVVSISTRQLFIVDECSSLPSLIVTSTPTLNVATKGRGRENRAATRITNTSLMSVSAFSSCWRAFRDQFRDFGPSLFPSLFYSTYLSQNFGNSPHCGHVSPISSGGPDPLCWFEHRPRPPQLRPDLTMMDREREGSALLLQGDPSPW